MKQLLYYIWLLCLLLTVADWLSPLEMVNRPLRMGVHCSFVGLFVYPVSYFIGGIELTKLSLKYLAGGIGAFLVMVVLLLVPGVTLIAFPLVSFTIGFFCGEVPWRSDYVYYKRGSTLMVHQVRENLFATIPRSGRHVQITPITPLFQWVAPLPEQTTFIGYAGWTRVQQDWTTFTRTPTEQLLLEKNWRNRPMHLAAQKREDSLVQIGHPPAAAFVFPAATHQGANTLGFLLGPERKPWRNYRFCFDETSAVEVKCGVGGRYTEEFKNFKPYGYILDVYASRNLGTVHQYLTLHLTHVTGLGKYRVGAYHNGNDSFIKFEGTLPPYAADYGYYCTLPNQLSFVNITRIDTAAHVVSGTFEASLKAPGINYFLTMQNGRFDLNYKAPLVVSDRRMER